ncbi:imidazole glycerol phosphate synthase subunit HisH [Candidatus Viadribacter manganicus]|uniref:Imidazole glycerol phosphate synthase subunit HisH n=1 Tax=Candidatus Viadribacter manganicus TaxID=1759059 RepID=A0A1B1AIG6_9PROT|nr:imidazole glycerol phosphate synthase subunit HisH [Candidatus Viadribacter manganicus]ANP46345.1 imidazole glycerol phosphate synthase subunit HisH [Candidatus Viadribacter manganicus]
MSVAVVKIGVGNTASVMFALERLGAAAVLTDDPARVAEAERVILPGVGAAAHAMKRLNESGVEDVLRNFSRPLLGICLGQQLLFETSDEGDAEGLGRIPGRVTRFPVSPEAPVPHMGWSKIETTRESALLEGLVETPYAYFVHSFICPASDATIATARYGAPFPAMVASGNVFGCQFHPERSGAAGATILRNFLSLPC